MKKNITKQDVLDYTGMSETEYHTAYQRYWRLNRRIENTGMGSQATANIPSAVLANWRHQQEGGRTPMFDQMREALRYTRNPNKFEVGYTDIRTQQLRDKWGNYNDIKLNVNGKEEKVNLNDAFRLYKDGKISREQYNDAIRQVKQSDQYINYESKK